jgi:mono/diheme cytochrome c family protein
MKRLPQTAVLIAIVLTCATANAADPANGKRLSERWCASCHIISPDQRQASVDAPAFPRIGREPDFNSGRLALFLLEPHPRMPNMSLTRTEASDIAAYIESLARSN